MENKLKELLLTASYGTLLGVLTGIIMFFLVRYFG